MSEDVPMIKVTIDGETLDVPKGWSIIQAADHAGKVIPRFCYHKKLSVAANCRMCLVDVDGARKPTPACATPAGDGMVVHTKSEKTIAYQKAVMEFLLINHPLDCPICDQGGECELQDVAMGYGKDVSRYNQGKRAVPDKDIGPLIETDLTRCIQCTRCVRFGQEIAGMEELGMIGRGEHSEIATFLEENVHSEMSGNVIDLCPVGALTNKPFRYQARAWEMQQKPLVSPHDCVGSNLWGHVRRGELMRTVPRENEALNETWLSDRDRYSYEALKSEARATQPMVKRDGEWETVEWAEAFEHLVKKFHHIANEYGADQIGALASPSSTTEEFYLLQKLMRAMGSPNVDHRLTQSDDRQLKGYGLFPGLDCELADIQGADCIVLIGSDVRVAQPIVHHRIRQASLQGAKVITINPAVFERTFSAEQDIIVNIDDIQLTLAAVAKALMAKKEEAFSAKAKDLLTSVEVSAEVQAVVKTMLGSNKVVMLAGELIQNHPEASNMLSLFSVIKKALAAQGGLLTQGANTAGAWLAGAVPHAGAAGTDVEAGLSAKQMLNTHEGLKSYILLGTEPDRDSAFGLRAKEALKKAECVVALTSFVTEDLLEYADVILPVAAFAENEGTFVNASGHVQSFAPIAKLPGEVKPAWKVLRVLANFLEVADFEKYCDISDVSDELSDCLAQPTCKGLSLDLPLALPTVQKQLKRATITSLYSVDQTVRHAPALQATHEAAKRHTIKVSPELATLLNLEEGSQALLQQNNGSGVTVNISIVPGVADKTVLVPAGADFVGDLGEAFEQISVLRV